MNEFLFLFRSNGADQREAMGNPERAQQSMQAWLDWIRGLEAKGHLKSPGHPLTLEGQVVRGPKQVVTDGPYAEAKDLLLGFSIVTARDLAEAVELSRGCPILRADSGSVEVRPIRVVPSM